MILHCPTCKKNVSVLEIQHTERSKDRTGKQSAHVQLVNIRVCLFFLMH